jgi:hypothetical protein
MSGLLYKVMGQPRFQGMDTCPASLAGKNVSLKSKDGETFDLSADAVCMSGRLKAILLESADAPIDLPLAKGPLGKVVEFMKYHVTIPFSEFKTPLESDNLVDCGCGKWDATFVSVDKDALFELMISATLLDIPSLFFLCACKCALMTKDKEAGKLRKEYSLTNDMTDDEETEIKEKFKNWKMWSTRREQGDSDDLAALGAILSSLINSADKQGILDSARTEDGSAMVNTKSYKSASYRVAVMSDPNILADAPEEVKADKDLIMAALGPSNGWALKFADIVLRVDKQVVLEAVKYSGSTLALAEPSLSGSKEFVAECVAVNPDALGGASDSLKGDKDFILDLCSKGYGEAFKCASWALKADTSFILEAVTKDPMVMKFASPDLKQDKSFVISVAKKCGAALQYMLPKSQADKDVVAAAVAQDPTAAIFAHTSRRVELGVGLLWDSEVELQAELKKQPPPALGPNTAFDLKIHQVAKEEIASYGCTIRLQKSVQFSALSTMTANMGQGNYIAANCWLDKIPYYERPEVDAVTLMWGAVGNIGMRWKAFASADFLNQNPEALLSIDDARKILCLTSCKMEPPEWYAGSFFDEYTRQGMVTPTAGVHSGTFGGWMPGEDAGMPHAHGYGPRPTDLVARPRSEPKTWLEAKLVELTKEKKSEKHDGPLGGWAALQGRAVEAEDAEVVDIVAAKEVAVAEQGPNVLLCAGARVRLTGLAAKNGQTGLVLKHHADGKWKVQLDADMGNALLKECFLEVISSPSEHTPEDEAAAMEAFALQKRKAFEERRLRVKEKLARAKEEAEAKLAQKPSAVRQEEQSTDAGSGEEAESTAEDEAAQEVLP